MSDSIDLNRITDIVQSILDRLRKVHVVASNRLTAKEVPTTANHTIMQLVKLIESIESGVSGSGDGSKVSRAIVEGNIALTCEAIAREWVDQVEPEPELPTVFSDIEVDGLWVGVLHEDHYDGSEVHQEVFIGDTQITGEAFVGEHKEDVPPEIEADLNSEIRVSGELSGVLLEDIYDNSGIHRELFVNDTEIIGEAFVGDYDKQLPVFPEPGAASNVSIQDGTLHAVTVDSWYDDSYVKVTDLQSFIHCEDEATATLTIP